MWNIKAELVEHVTLLDCEKKFFLFDGYGNLQYNKPISLWNDNKTMYYQQIGWNDRVEFSKFNDSAKNDDVKEYLNQDFHEKIVQYVKTTQFKKRSSIIQEKCGKKNSAAKKIFSRGLVGLFLPHWLDLVYKREENEYVKYYNSIKSNLPNPSKPRTTKKKKDGKKTKTIKKTSTDIITTQKKTKPKQKIPTATKKKKQKNK